MSMNGLTITSPTLGTARPTGLGVAAAPAGANQKAEARTFERVLGVQRSLTPPARVGAGPEERAAVEARRRTEAREAAELLVSTTFVEPVFKQMRESERTAPPFAPSEGEKQFRALLDTRLAQEMVKSARWGLVDRVARDLLA
jgi:hypothetical protein